MTRKNRTKEEAAKLRKAVAEFCKTNTGPEAAEEFGISVDYVRLCCREYKVKCYSSRNNLNLRLNKDTAVTYAVTYGVAEAATLFNIPENKIINYCKNAGKLKELRKNDRIRQYSGVAEYCRFNPKIKMPKFRRGSNEPINPFIVLRMLIEGKRQTEIAEKLGVSRARIEQIVSNARAAQIGL